MKEPPVHPLHWRHAWRIVASRIPRINLYERIADPHDQRSLIKLEQLTNPRVAMEKGRFSPLRKGDFFRPHASVYVKAPFANLTTSRFGNGAYPVLYAASNEGTALAEKKYHSILFWRAHHTPAVSVNYRALNLEISGSFHDARRMRSQLGAVYSPHSYTVSQTLGLALWKAGSLGVAYESVRYAKGDCVGVFSPQTVTSCELGPIYEFHWDGKALAGTFRLDPL